MTISTLAATTGVITDIHCTKKIYLTVLKSWSSSTFLKAKWPSHNSLPIIQLFSVWSITSLYKCF